jgi:fimbrial chaperone protein
MTCLRSLFRATRCLWLATALVPSVASAASFTVSPTQVVLTSKATSALLTLRNESSETIRFQLSVFSWDQGATGDMDLKPTTDIVFFPKLVSLSAREERKIRIGTESAFGTSERTYRIFVEELPSIAKPDQSSSGVSMRTRMGIPIFLQPDATRIDGAVTGLSLDRSSVLVRVENKGTVHFVTGSVHVTGATSNGVLVFDKVVNGWYVLAGKGQSYEIPLTPAECGSAVALTVEVTIGETTLRERAQRPADGCRTTASP